MAAVLAFPAAGWRKICGVLIGVSVIFTFNLLRIASLYWIGVHYPACFDTAHVSVWPSGLIVLTLALCVGWLQWVTKNHEAAPV